MLNCVRYFLVVELSLCKAYVTFLSEMPEYACVYYTMHVCLTIKFEIECFEKKSICVGGIVSSIQPCVIHLAALARTLMNLL